jgi:hypothetical protein
MKPEDADLCQWLWGHLSSAEKTASHELSIEVKQEKQLNAPVQIKVCPG